jgi:hypothetical protein
MDESLSLLGINNVRSLIKENGHDALHLTPYHPNWSPTELGWEDIKIRVAQKCMSTNMKKKQIFVKKFC